MLTTCCSRPDRPVISSGRIRNIDIARQLGIAHRIVKACFNRGNPYLRKLFVQGARAVLQQSAKQSSGQTALSRPRGSQMVGKRSIFGVETLRFGFSRATHQSRLRHDSPSRRENEASPRLSSSSSSGLRECATFQPPRHDRARINVKCRLKCSLHLR